MDCGIGGNRKKWENVDVTAVEINPQIAHIYQDIFQEDKVIVGDSLEYLPKHYKEYDFIWISRPCQSHSIIRFIASKKGDYEPVLPDMSLYSVIIFLKHFAKCKWVVENVRSYYNPLIKPYEVSRHYFWSNFFIDNKKYAEPKSHNQRGVNGCYGFDLSGYELDHRKDQIIRNMVNPELGAFIFDCAFKRKQTTLGGNSDLLLSVASPSGNPR